MSHDSWMHKGVRRAMRPLVATPVRPNHLTTLRLATAMAAAAAFAEGSEAWRGAGVWFFLASVFFDHADGELARLSGRTSRSGHIYDLITDGTSNILVFLGLGIGLMGGWLGPAALLLALAAGLAIGLVFAATLYLEARHGPRAGEMSGLDGVDPDHGMFAVPVAVWFGVPDWLLVAAAVGAPAFAGYYLWTFRHRLRPPPGGPAAHRKA